MLDEISEDPKSFEEYDVFENDVTDLTEVIIVHFFFESIVYKFQCADNKTLHFTNLFFLMLFQFVLGARH